MEITDEELASVSPLIGGGKRCQYFVINTLDEENDVILFVNCYFNSYQSIRKNDKAYYVLIGPNFLVDYPPDYKGTLIAPFVISETQYLFLSQQGDLCKRNPLNILAYQDYQMVYSGEGEVARRRVIIDDINCLKGTNYKASQIHIIEFEMNVVPSNHGAPNLLTINVDSTSERHIKMAYTEDGQTSTELTISKFNCAPPEVDIMIHSHDQAEIKSIILIGVKLQFRISIT